MAVKSQWCKAISKYSADYKIRYDLYQSLFRYLLIEAEWRIYASVK